MGCFFVTHDEISFLPTKNDHVGKWKKTSPRPISGSVIEAIVERKHELLVEFISSDLQKEGNVKLQEERCDSKELGIFSVVAAGFQTSTLKRNSLEGLHELGST